MMQISPETTQTIITTVGGVLVAAIASIGGYFARGIGKKPSPVTVTQRKCPDHTDVVVGVSLLKDVPQDIKDLTKKVEAMFDQVFTILRHHEGEINYLRGTIATMCDDVEAHQPHSG
jgi:hypothetical protein